MSAIGESYKRYFDARIKEDRSAYILSNIAKLRETLTGCAQENNAADPVVQEEVKEKAMNKVVSVWNKTFTFEKFPIRTFVDTDGVLYFVVDDVCAVNDRISSALEWRRKGERAVSPVVTPDGIQELSVLSESTLYRVITCCNSFTATELLKWVAYTVITDVRHNGLYDDKGKLPPEVELDMTQAALDNAITVVRRFGFTGNNALLAAIRYMQWVDEVADE
jgi:prophage antirepressor-like protein